MDKDLAVKARKLEMDYFRKMGVYFKIHKERGMKIISTKLIDTNKLHSDDLLLI